MFEYIVNPPNIYLLKVNNRNRKRCEICSELTIKTPERSLWRLSVVFAINFGHISYLFLVFLLLTLKTWMLAGKGLVILSRCSHLLMSVPRGVFRTLIELYVKAVNGWKLRRKLASGRNCKWWNCLKNTI